MHIVIHWKARHLFLNILDLGFTFLKMQKENVPVKHIDKCY
jgi:hypothetical protein